MLRFQLSEVDVVKVREGARVTVTTGGLPDETFDCTVWDVSPVRKDQIGVAQVQVSINVKGHLDLRPGMQASAHIHARVGSGSSPFAGNGGKELMPITRMNCEADKAIGVTLLLSEIASVSPLVGGLGMMNIMLLG